MQRFEISHMLLNNATTFFDLIHLFQFKWRPDNRNNDYCCYEAVVTTSWGFPGAVVVKNPPANAGDIREAGSIPGLGRCPGEGNGNPFQYSCQENPMDRGAWQAMVHSIAKNRTRLKQLSRHTHIISWDNYSPNCDPFREQIALFI